MNHTVVDFMKYDCWRRDGSLSGELLFDIAKCRILWQLWSPNWQFDQATLDATAMSFDNAEFVDVTIHSYRHRYGNARGEVDRATLTAAVDERAATHL